MDILFLVLIIAVVALAALGGQLLNHRQKRQAENARLLERALENPTVDRATLETLAYQVTGRRSPRHDPVRRGAMAWILAIGWVGLFLGAGLLIGGITTYDREVELGGWIVGLIGLGFVTYPFALRELESRRVT